MISDITSNYDQFKLMFFMFAARIVTNFPQMSNQCSRCYEQNVKIYQETIA